MTIGKDWSAALRNKEARILREAESEVHVEAQAIVAALPERVRSAMLAGEESVDVGLGFLTPGDVDCGDVDRCYDIVRDQAGGVLRAQDLTGRARIVFDWCARNDLACYLDPHKVQDSPFDDFNYALRAKPR